MSARAAKQLWDGHVPDRRRTLVALLICGGLAVLLISAMLSLSARAGRMAMPITYDDVAYALTGFAIYQSLLDGHKLAPLLQLLHEHAPLQSALAVLAQFVFGFHEWAFYAVNGMLVLALVAVVLWIVRPLRLLPQIAIALVVLVTPVTANLVTEFRPDLWWGFLCGLTAYLIFDPRFLRGPLSYQVGTAIVSALALLGKPSGSPATIIFFGYAATASFLLLLREEKQAGRSTEGYWKRFGLFLAAVALLIAPYYLQNIQALYDYLHTGFVEQADIYAMHGIWNHLAFFSVGPAYRYGLYLTLWLGLIVFLINVVRLLRRSNFPALLRYLAYAAAVFAAYSAPTLSPIKSYYLGGIFYGTFLIFTAHGLVLIFLALQSSSLAAARAGAVALLVTSAGIFQPTPLVPSFDPQDAPDLRAVNEQIVAALTREVWAMPRDPLPIVFIPAPAPVTGAYLGLRLGWQGLKIGGAQGYYVRTLQEQLDLLQQAQFAVLTEITFNRYPGELLSPELIKIVSADENFLKLIDFTDHRGRHTYLYARPTASIAGLLGEWIPSKGLSVGASRAALERFPFIQIKGKGNYDWLKTLPSVSATVETNGQVQTLPASFRKDDADYRIIIDTSTLKPIAGDERVQVHLAFDSFFVPKEIGINEDTHELVVWAPTKISLLRHSP